MERAAREGSADILTARSNRQTSAPVYTSHLTQRKSFHPRQESKENNVTVEVANGSSARPASSGSSSDSRLGASHATRIPRPSPSQKSSSRPRKPLSLSEAYRLAVVVVAARGSPCPAPRSWRQKGELGESRMQKILGQGPLSFGRRGARRTSSSGREDDTQSSGGSLSHRSEASELGVNEKPTQQADNQARMENNTKKGNNIFTKSKVGPKVAEAAQELHRKTSNNSLDGNSPARSSRPWGARGKPGSHWLARIVSSPGDPDAADMQPAANDAPIPSVEKDSASTDGSAAEYSPIINRSPSKSFAWQADADFTSADLQISSSPPVKNGSSHDSLRARPRNTKIEEIKQLEIEAALRFPDESQDPSHVERGEPGSQRPEDEGSLPPNRQVGRTNTKIDEIRAREIESLSKKALATARLDAIRERNSEYRSPSPDAKRESSTRDLPRAGTPAPSRKPPGDGHKQTLLEEAGEHIPDTPITIFRTSPSDDDATRSKDHSGDVDAKAAIPAPPNPSKAQSRSPDDSREVLRRLARVASTSPSPERREDRGTQGSSEGAHEVRSDGKGASSTKVEKKVESPEIRAPDKTKSSVASSGLRRISSTESASTKRSSMAQSDGDPIDRIEAEMKLFAPLENQSERGSIRAPSPDPDEDSDSGPDVDETPRPSKPDPLSQPTPRVIGAYIDTPATVKVERPESLKPEAPKTEGQQRSHPSLAVAPLLRGRATPGGAGGKQDDSASEDLVRKENGRQASIPSSRRARSVPRNRSPLFNSVRPPSVRDDLLEIQRLHQIEDSTLDDLGDFLLPPLSTEPDAATAAEKPEVELAPGSSDRERELEAYDRINKSLKGGLLGIQTAKKGIERLEGRVSRSDDRPPRPDTAHGAGHRDCSVCAGLAPAAPVTYIHIPIPRLYNHDPTFRFSLLGLVLFFMATWFVTETAVCSLYCRPEYCVGGRDCVCAPDDLFFGYAIPVKVDQWITGGEGRALAGRLWEYLDDAIADAKDLATGRDINMVDTKHMTFEQKRQHRRRLRKRGLTKTRQSTPEQREKLDAWQAAREARDKARNAREMGYDIGDGLGDESMSGDERISHL